VLDERGLGRLKLVLVALSVLAASVGAAFALGVVGVPSVEAVENRFGPVDEETTVVETDLVVTNPNPVGVDLGGVTVDYAVRMNDVRMANGTKAGVELTTGETTLPFTTRMRNERIPDWWVSHVRNDERTSVTVDATVTSSLLGGRSVSLAQERRIETDLVSAFDSDETRPVNAGQPFVSDPVLYVNETRGEWGQVTEAETPVEMAFVVYNPKSVPYTITEVGYEVAMNGIGVGNGTTERPHVIAPRETETVETTPTIRNERLDDWWVSHLENDQVTELRIDFYARVEFAGGEFRVPLDALTYERTIETDVFGNEGDENGTQTENESENATAGSDAGTPSPTSSPSDDPTSSPTATPTDGGLLDGGTPTGTAGLTRTSTPTFEPTPTPSPEPAATPTDDGGLL
jgi:LEA14-like dessication related protein